MISFWAERNQRACHSKKTPLAFFTNLFKRKKYKCRNNDGGVEVIQPQHSNQTVSKVPTTLSVSVMDMRITSPCPISPALSTLTLTPGRTRDIDQDMEALRLSRQDNPFLQVLASRESLADSLIESESDDANLMSQEFPHDADVDPLSLPEIHEHMIRSPPPTTWPRSPNFKIFQFPLSQDDVSSQENYSSSMKKFPLRASLDEGSKYFRHIEFNEGSFGTYSTIHSTHSPRASVIKPQQRSSSECREQGSFSLANPGPMKSLTDLNRKHLSSACELERSEPDVTPTLPLLSKQSS